MTAAPLTTSAETRPPMRVLWLTSTPALGAAFFGRALNQGEGWVAALERDVKAEGSVMLDVAFPWRVSRVEEHDTARPGTESGEQVGKGAGEEGRHRYFPFPRYPRGGRLQQLLFDVTSRLEPEGELGHLEEIIERSQPDLVHIWGTEPFYGLIAPRCPVPILIEIQGVRTACAEAYCAGLSRFDLLRYGDRRRLLNGRSLLHRYYRYQSTAEREQRILKNARYVSGRTDWDRMACSALAPHAHYFHCDRVLRPAFREGQWERRERSASEPLRIVSTLRGNAYKGVETIARTAQLLRNLLPGGCRWTLIGIRRGEEIHRIVERKLRCSFDELGIELPGRMDAAEVAATLLASDLYVMPSHIENSPNGLAEAMAMGLPAVATRVGGTPSLMLHGEQGLLVPPGDPWATAGAIRRLAEDPALGDRLGAAARDAATQRHDPAKAVDTLTDIYRQILDREGHPSAQGKPT